MRDLRWETEDERIKSKEQGTKTEKPKLTDH